MRVCCIAIVLCALALPGAAQGLPGTYVLTRDSDGQVPKRDATITLTFTGGTQGHLAMSAVQPGETVTDTGDYRIDGKLITIHFKEMVWEAARQPFTLDGCTLTLPFKALGGTSGPGTSVWRRRDCAPSSFATFTADKVALRGSERKTGKIFVAERAIRAEGEEGGRRYILIVRLDRSLVWNVSVDDRTYTETPLPVGAAASLALAPTLPTGCRALGEETLAGYRTQKRECRIRVGGKDRVETYWAAADLGGIVIKQVAGGETLTFENIQRQPIDPALFEIPRGFRKGAP